ncbi:MAG: hypothetical protein R3E03_02365 [Novosphingobium sp.]
MTFTADLGQEKLEPARAKAKLMGLPDSFIYVTICANSCAISCSR